MTYALSAAKRFCSTCRWYSMLCGPGFSGFPSKVADGRSVDLVAEFLVGEVVLGSRVERGLVGD